MIGKCFNYLNIPYMSVSEHSSGDHAAGDRAPTPPLHHRPRRRQPQADHVSNRLRHPLPRRCRCYDRFAQELGCASQWHHRQCVLGTTASHRKFDSVLCLCFGNAGLCSLQGCLPLVLMFDIKEETELDQSELNFQGSMHSIIHLLCKYIIV